MAEETTAPTVDQHNSFKVSYTLNEKEAGPSDPKPMPNASKECHLFLPDLVNRGNVLVAIGKAYMECVPTDTVHGIPLGEENVRVTITVPKLKRALLPILTNEATCIKEAIGGFVVWLKRLVVIETSLSQASQGPSHAPDLEAEGSKRTKKIPGRKKIQSQSEILRGLLCKNMYRSTVRVYFSSPYLTSSTECRLHRLHSRKGRKYSTDLKKRTKGKAVSHAI
ncbi:hypothetical protein TIFTF001_032058 [Ficus carica]|uniref:DUF8039 domain-containing protein n=1 Tax=Ficus carica TaxID=3494 RepID=A0AA88DZS4_FICCA|nr:hypothetical protein TIFTF001_032058 [Ficus carica]